MKMLLINTGGTSTKIGLFNDDRSIDVETVRHEPSELSDGGTPWSQYALRKTAVLDFLGRRNIAPLSLDAIVSRGPAVRPLRSGVYAIDGAMLDDARSGRYGEHACAVGCQIAF